MAPLSDSIRRSFVPPERSRILVPSARRGCSLYAGKWVLASPYRLAANAAHSSVSRAEGRFVIAPPLSLMPAWGYGSDENDETYDILGLSADQRSGNIGVNEAGRREKWLTVSANDRIPVGVVVWFVKQGCKVPVHRLEAAIRDLEAYDARTSGYVDANERARAVLTEISLLRRAVAAGGQIDPVGTVGINEAMVRLGKGGVSRITPDQFNTRKNTVVNIF